VSDSADVNVRFRSLKLLFSHIVISLIFVYKLSGAHDQD
jgi:hypothetical protein